MGEIMKKTLLLLTFLAVAGMSGTPAQAANHYVSALAGVSWMQNSDVSYTSDVAVGADVWHNNFDSGVTGVAAIGCDYGTTRLEVEAGYQRNDFRELGYPYADQATSDGWSGRSALSGKTSVYSLMGNAFYDIPLGSGVKLYGMAGIGVAQVNFEGNYAVDTYSGEDTSGNPYSDLTEVSHDPSVVVSEPLHYKSHATAFAYQLGAGITIPLSKGVVLDARYRYFATADFTLSGPVETTWAENGVPNDTGATYSTLYPEYSLNTHISSHSVLLGLRVDI